MSFKKHRKFDLLNRVVNALEDDGWNVLYLHDTSYHPFLLRIYKNNERHDLRIYIWNLTHGGGQARREDEYRIQITGVDQFTSSDNEKVLILGWWEQGGVFAGFDYNFHTLPLGSSPSMQIREVALRSGYVHGMGTWERDNNEIAIAIRPEFLSEYIINMNDLHSFGESKKDLEILNNVIGIDDEKNQSKIDEVTLKRRTVLQSVWKKVRDTSFKDRVLVAYSNQCSFCGLQLKLIDAAHIVPVEKDGNDMTSNGIALCALHHRAYDRKLLGFNTDYQILISQDKMDGLAKMGLDGERTRFEKNLRSILHLPPTISDRPHVDFITEANRIRGWNKV